MHIVCCAWDVPQLGSVWDSLRREPTWTNMVHQPFRAWTLRQSVADIICRDLFAAIALRGKCVCVSNSIAIVAFVSFISRGLSG